MTKSFKSSFSIFAALLLFFCTGCTLFTQLDKEKMADYVVEAIIQNDSQALWDVLSTATQDEILGGCYNDEAKAKEILLAVIREVVCKRNNRIDPDKLAGDEALQKELAQKLQEDPSFFIKVNGLWYIGAN